MKALNANTPQNPFYCRCAVVAVGWQFRAIGLEVAYIQTKSDYPADYNYKISVKFFSLIV